DGFQWKVWLVAASGFFTTSYSIFSTNVILPALAYVYPNCSIRTSLMVNLATLGSTMVGMVLFGFLADRYGRKSVYGVELVIVIVATIGMTEATSGYGSGYMDIYGWIGFWRVLLGLGLGAEYPLSAVIAAEWSSTRSRAKMMASVFLMQSLGQLAAYALGLLILTLVVRAKNLNGGSLADVEQTKAVIDEFWRIFICIGAVPALIAIGLRRIIPETPLWLAHHRHIGRATEAVGAVYSYPIDEECDDEHRRSRRAYDEPDRTMVQGVVDYLVGVRKYLAENDRWRALLGVCAVWFLVDVAFYGLGLDSPKTINKIWLSNDPGTSATARNLIRNIINVSTGSVTGSVILLFAINYIPRVTWMTCWFIGLGGLFLVSGSTFFVAYESDKYALTITLYVLAQAMFNLGPNTITFILPAELFDTRYRATFYGIAAAAGKLGAVAIQLIVSLAVQDKGRNEFAGLLLGMCPTMLLGALVTWVWIPEVQYPRGHQEDADADDRSIDEGDRPSAPVTFRERLKLANIPLDELAKNPSAGQVIGFRKNMWRLKQGLVKNLGLSRDKTDSSG
ncbi:MFS general substrate transporter, partial [Thozetella sp. PMI_491]